MIDLKDIHIGKLVEIKWTELDISLERTGNFLKCNEQEIKEMFLQKDMSAEDLLKWSKLLEYDFFRLYSQHLIFYAPPASNNYNKTVKRAPKASSLPLFRKNLYTQEMIIFFLDLLNNKEKTRLQIITEYKIPKTTLYKWIKKYDLEE
ncbi:transposase [Chryseobacterium limigenitum]|uniref:transposase n=1 Tax=Chryseobacterium limigenitum TaxID=1612149 RepID=UPI003397A68C